MTGSEAVDPPPAPPLLLPRSPAAAHPPGVARSPPRPRAGGPGGLWPCGSPGGLQVPREDPPPGCPSRSGYLLFLYCFRIVFLSFSYIISYILRQVMKHSSLHSAPF